MKLLLPLELKEAEEPEFFGVECELKLATGDGIPAGSFEGYASVFDVIDRGGDIAQAGAFKASLAEWRKRKSLPPMLWMHDQSNPIGVWTSMAEDDKGLKVTGELITDVPQGAMAYALMKRGALKGMSIGYRTRDADIDPATGARKLKKVDLFEISLVTIAMLPDAAVTAVKGDALIPSDRDLEQAYRDGGLSQREAKIAVAVTKKAVLRDGGRNEPAPRDGAADALMSIRKASAAIAG